jgi:hypothetical protein
MALLLGLRLQYIYGEAVGKKTCQCMEYTTDTNPNNDMFSNGLKDVPPTIKCICVNGVHEK